MNQHQTTSSPAWFHSHYRGEDRDDGCANELSVYREPAADRLDILLTNVDFAGVGHDNTYSLTRADVAQLHAFLGEWLSQN